MEIDKEEYAKMVDEIVPRSKTLKNCTFAFLVGGLICTIGQVFINLYKMLGIDETNASTLASLTLIVISVILTAVHVYDNIAKHAGAGTLVPITGFANAVASPSIEFKSEGHIMGISAKMFIIAGPVIVFSTLASVLYGLIYWLCICGFRGI